MTILAVGQDSGLLSTRAEVLRRTGADVVESGSAAAIELLETTRFDAVVLCHSVSAQEAEAIGRAAHQPEYSVPVIQVIPISSRNRSSRPGVADAISEADPAMLVNHVIQLLNAVGKQPPTATRPARNGTGQA